MRNKKLLFLVNFVLVALVSRVAKSDTTINFDNLTQAVIPSGYGGLNWSNFYARDSVTNNSPSGYVYGRTSGNFVAYNGGGNAAYFESTNSFTVKSAYLTAAWNNGLQVSITGYSNGVVAYSQTYIVNTTSPSNITFNWVNVNKILFTSSGGVSAGYPDGLPAPFARHFVLDDLVLSSNLSVADLSLNAYALRSVYNIQSATLNAGLSYDCTVFDKEGVCLSTGGRYSTTNLPSASATSGLLIGSYKYDKNIRLGAWVDQNLSTNNADGLKLGNSKPLLGVFGVWSERNDGLGYEVKVSAGYGEKDLTVTRTSSNEGSAKVNMKGIQSVSSYGIALDADWIAAPYAGLKYVSISRGGYTEGGSSALTYDTLRQETTSVVAGVKFTGKIDPQTFAVLSAGVEHDLNHNVGQYSAGSSNTTAFNSDVKKTRPVVSAGVYYDLDKTQRLGLNGVVRQEPFQSTSSTSAMATYTVGF